MVKKIQFYLLFLFLLVAFSGSFASTVGEKYKYIFSVQSIDNPENAKEVIKITKKMFDAPVNFNDDFDEFTVESEIDINPKKIEAKTGLSLSNFKKIILEK